MNLLNYIYHIKSRRHEMLKRKCMHLKQQYSYYSIIKSDLARKYARMIDNLERKIRKG